MLPPSVFDDVDPAERAVSAAADPGPLIYALLPQSTADGAASAGALNARSSRLGGFSGGGDTPSLGNVAAAIGTPGWRVVRLRNLQGQPSMVYRTEHGSDEPDVTCRLVADEFIDYQWNTEVVVRQTMGIQSVGCLGLNPVTLPQLHKMTARLYVGLLPVMLLYIATCVVLFFVVSSFSYAMDRGMIPVFDGKAQALVAVRLAVFGSQLIYLVDLAAAATAPQYAGGLLAGLILAALASAGATRYFFRLDSIAEDLPVKEAVKLWAYENQATIWIIAAAAAMGGHVGALAFSGIFAMRRFSCPAGVARRVVYTWLGLPGALLGDTVCLTICTLLLDMQTPDVIVPLTSYMAGFMSALGIVVVLIVAVLAPVAEEESRFVSRLAAVFAMKRQAQWVKAQEEKALQEAEEHERRARELEEAGGVLEDREDDDSQFLDGGEVEFDGEAMKLGPSYGGEEDSKALRSGPGRGTGRSGASTGRGSGRIIRKVGVSARTRGLKITTASAHRVVPRTGTNPFRSGRRTGRANGGVTARVGPSYGLSAAERELAAREDAYRAELEDEAKVLGVDHTTYDGQLELARRAEEPLELDDKGGFAGLAPPVPSVHGVRPEVVRFLQQAVREKGVYRGPSTMAPRVQGVASDGRRVAFGGNGGQDEDALDTSRSAGLGLGGRRRRDSASARERTRETRSLPKQVAVPGMTRNKNEGGCRGRVGGRHSVVAEAREALQTHLGYGNDGDEGSSTSGGGGGGKYKKGQWGGSSAMQIDGGPPLPFDETTYRLPSVIHGRVRRASTAAAPGAGGLIDGAGRRTDGDDNAQPSQSLGFGAVALHTSAGTGSGGGAITIGSAFGDDGEGPRSPTPEARGAAMGLQWVDAAEDGDEDVGGRASGRVLSLDAGAPGLRAERGSQSGRARLVSQASARSYASSTGGLVPQGIAARMGLGGLAMDLPGSVADASFSDAEPASPSQGSMGSTGSPYDMERGDSSRGGVASRLDHTPQQAGVALAGKRRQLP